jgi:phenylacetate-CoA ligase
MDIHGKFINHVGFRLISRRDGLPGVQPFLRQLEESQYWAPDQLVEYQFHKVKALLSHAYRNTSFYRERFESIGFNPQKFKDLSELKQIPPLTRKDILEHIDSMVAPNLLPHQVHRDATGGSSGMHTPFYRNNDCLSFKKAVEYRCNKWAGWSIGDKIAYYWSAAQDFAKSVPLGSRVKNGLGYRALMLYSGRLDEATLELHRRQLGEFAPGLMRVFPNPLSVLARHLRQAGKQPISIPSIISVGEPLLESHRQIFKDVFGSRVFNCYVSRECGNMACECGAEQGLLHINSEMVYVEFEEIAGRDPRGPKSLLITDLSNYGMPFIRYRISDLAWPVEKACKCGRTLPLLRMDGGRMSDFLISPLDGSLVSGVSFLHHLIAEGPEVGQVQVVQDQVDHLRINLVKSRGFSEDKINHFHQTINKIFKGAMTYDIQYVDCLENEKSGKYMFTKCLVEGKL